jgi:hypothetical protein
VTKAASLQELLQLAVRQDRERWDGEAMFKAVDPHRATATGRKKRELRATEMPLEQRLLLERQLRSKHLSDELQQIQQKSSHQPLRSKSEGKGVRGNFCSILTLGGSGEVSENGRVRNRSQDISPNKMDSTQGGGGLKESDIDLWVDLASSCSDETVLLERARAMAISQLLEYDARSPSPDAGYGRHKRREGGVEHGEALAPESTSIRIRPRQRLGAGAEGHEQRIDERELEEEDMRMRLTRYFQRYNPARLADVGKLVVQFSGREAVLSVLLRQKYGGNFVLRDRHTDLSGLAMTPEEKEAKLDLQRDREAMRYAEFFCREKCYTRSDHARISPYHSSHLKPVPTLPDESSDSRRSSWSGTPNAQSPGGAGTRTPLKVQHKLPAGGGTGAGVEGGGDVANSSARSAVMSSHMWPLQKLVQPDTRQKALDEAGSWSAEQVALFLSETNARYLATDSIEVMRRKVCRSVSVPVFQIVSFARLCLYSVKRSLLLCSKVPAFASVSCSASTPSLPLSFRVRAPGSHITRK